MVVTWLAVGLNREHGAALDRLAVQVHGAGAAVARCRSPRACPSGRGRHATIARAAFSARCRPGATHRSPSPRRARTCSSHTSHVALLVPKGMLCHRANGRGLSNLGDSMEAVTRTFRFEGHRLVYDEYGSGERVVVLMPGLLFSRRMHAPLAEALASGGHRVLCIDLLGHGDSDRPPEMSSYSMTTFGRQAIALLDHAGVERAVLGGTSLGANTALEAAAAAPERVRGLLIEMPVLDNALLGCAIGFTPLLVGLTFGAPLARLAGRGAQLVPRGDEPAGRHAARLGEPGPEALGVGAAGPLLRPRGAAQRGAPADEAANARDRPLPRPDPSLLRLRHARPRAAERPARRGLLDPRAAPDPRAPYRGDRRLRGRVLLRARPLRWAQAGDRLEGPFRGPPPVRPLRPGLHYASPPCPTANSRRRRCAASARSASGRPARPSSASSWSATAPPGCS